MRPFRHNQIVGMMPGVKVGMMPGVKVGMTPTAQAVPQPQTIASLQTQPSAAPASQEMAVEVDTPVTSTGKAPCDAERELINNIFDELVGYRTNSIEGTVESLHIEIAVSDNQMSEFKETLAGFGANCEVRENTDSKSVILVSNISMDKLIDLQRTLEAAAIKETEANTKKTEKAVQENLTTFPALNSNILPPLTQATGSVSTSGMFATNSAAQTTSRPGQLPVLTAEMLVSLRNTLPLAPENEVAPKQPGPEDESSDNENSFHV